MLEIRRREMSILGGGRGYSSVKDVGLPAAPPVPCTVTTYRIETLRVGVSV